MATDMRNQFFCISFNAEEFFQLLHKRFDDTCEVMDTMRRCNRALNDMDTDLRDMLVLQVIQVRRQQSQMQTNLADYRAELSLIADPEATSAARRLLELQIATSDVRIDCQCDRLVHQFNVELVHIDANIASIDDRIEQASQSARQLSGRRLVVQLMLLVDTYSRLGEDILKELSDHCEHLVELERIKMCLLEWRTINRPGVGGGRADLDRQLRVMQARRKKQVENGKKLESIVKRDSDATQRCRLDLDAFAAESDRLAATLKALRSDLDQLEEQL